MKEPDANYELQVTSYELHYPAFPVRPGVGAHVEIIRKAALPLETVFGLPAMLMSYQRRNCASAETGVKSPGLRSEWMQGADS